MAERIAEIEKAQREAEESLKARSPKRKQAELLQNRKRLELALQIDELRQSNRRN